VANYASDCECEPIFRGENDFANLQKSATINDPDEKNDPVKLTLDVFPNPANDYVTVACNEAIQRLVLINSTGKIVFDNTGLNTENHTFTIARLPAGIYMLKTTTHNGYDEVRKIVKGE
jgi:hypothetical protein